jgi:hypothetical protein
MMIGIVPSMFAAMRRVDAGAAVGDLLEHQAVREAGEAEAAVRLGDLAVHQARLPGLLADLRREGAVLVQLTATGTISLRANSRAVSISCFSSSENSKLGMRHYTG